MSGVGDNSQMHILLADCLVGDPEQGMVGGERPALSWAEGATGGEPHLGPDTTAIRCFRLFDGQGPTSARRGMSPETRSVRPGWPSFSGVADEDAGMEPISEGGRPACG
ncbi:hypothetical protein SPRI_3630 [Streptomyces pristinaespiralis]|uniref:Uncharacterized protein n=1 Tax=Streptomyces pristinaespiralis TaxID=38300 RepID=A0A0M5IQK9_STRPR|nr:hypothetical protein SPRI_3630 [Streptomyces pristinaespiralis]